jgi:hypothetical protein
MIPRRRIQLLFLLSLACASSAHQACAEPERSPPGGTSVLLVVSADAREAAVFSQVTRELLGRLSIALRVERVRRLDMRVIAGPASAHPRYLARLYADLRAPSSATLWIVDPSHDRILIRELPRNGGDDELLREELGHIIETSTEGLLSGEEIGLPRAAVAPLLEPRPSAPMRSPRTAHAARPRWQATLLYDVAALSSSVRLVHGPEAGIWIQLPLRADDFGLWLTGQYRFPVHIEAAPVGARLEGVAARALLTFDRSLQRTLKLRLGLGGGADILSVQPEEARANTASLAESRIVSFFVAEAALGLEWRMSSSFSIWSRLVVDGEPMRTRYVFERRDGQQTVLEPWRARPGLALGIGFP